jgi:hypothetical protein
MTTENVEATKEAGVAELKATQKARAAKQAPPPVVYCLEAPPLPTASPLTALTPATLRPSDSGGDVAFSLTLRVLKACLWICSAVSVPLLQTTTPVTISCSWTRPSSKTGQLMATLIFSPGSSGPWAAKRSPELLRSMIWPELVSTGARWFQTAFWLLGRPTAACLSRFHAGEDSIETA